MEKIDDFVGRVFDNKSGGSYTILPWDGKISNQGKGCKMYPIFCAQCEKDKEMHPNPYYIRKGDAKAGYIPCGCSKFKILSEHQVTVHINRYLEGSCVKFLGFNESYNGSKTTLRLQCSKHNTCKVQDSYSNLINSKQSGCSFCGDDMIRLSKIKEDSVFIESFIASKGFMEGTRFTKNIEKSGTGADPSYWDVYCPVCSEDKFVINGLCSGVFTSLGAGLRSGEHPCRCARTSSLTRAQAEFEIKEEMDKLGYIFVGWKSPKEHYDCGSVFDYVCNAGHSTSSSHQKFIWGKYRCRFCTNFGFTKSRAKFEDYLYVLKFTKDDEVFIKVGRCFNTVTRFSEFSRVYNIELLHLYQDSHKVVYDLEKELHKTLQPFHTIPYIKFGGGATECFSDDCLEHLEGCLSFVGIKKLV